MIAEPQRGGLGNTRSVTKYGVQLGITDNESATKFFPALFILLRTKNLPGFNLCIMSLLTQCSKADVYRHTEIMGFLANVFSLGLFETNMRWLTEKHT